MSDEKSIQKAELRWRQIELEVNQTCSKYKQLIAKLEDGWIAGWLEKIKSITLLTTTKCCKSKCVWCVLGVWLDAISRTSSLEIDLWIEKWDKFILDLESDDDDVLRYAIDNRTTKGEQQQLKSR